MSAVTDVSRLAPNKPSFVVCEGNVGVPGTIGNDDQFDSFGLAATLSRHGCWRRRCRRCRAHGADDDAVRLLHIRKLP